MTDDIDRRYAKATHTVVWLMADSNRTYTPEEAAHLAAFKHGLGLNQYGRLVREAKDRYDD